ncbi:MAG: hydroxymethylglutaryl-CoA lyase [Deltaproteobacteria bacterium]|nr:MAG: hydroxymethylglutaryl-CoA lyase [Deltaproteobacteria bacterium]
MADSEGTTPTTSTPNSIRIVEVGPRDGLQNERVRLNPAERIRLIERLVDAGVREVEVGSFVHPRWIPQMAGTDEVLRGLHRQEGVAYWALVPNRRGLDNALEAGAEHVAVFVSSSETHNRRNLNRSIDESIENVREVVSDARQEGLTVRGYISTVFGCPWEGDIDFDRVLDIARELFAMGVAEISFGDTTGMGTPYQVRDGMTRALDAFGPERVALHLHDTRGLAVANALLAVEAGVTTLDASIGGMGGCPYAAGASGNVGTEDLVHLLHATGRNTGIRLEDLLGISRSLEDEHGATLRSRYHAYSRAGHS